MRLVASSKLTRRCDYHFLRPAEEEFISPGVPIAFHPDYGADQLPDPELFSGLVAESYRYRDMSAAFEQIKRFARTKPTVLVEADDPLFRVLRERRPEMANVSVVSREPTNDDRWIGIGGRPFSYRQNAVRQTWHKVKAALQPELARQETAPSASCELTRIPNGMRIRCHGNHGPVPVSVNASFHPNWQRADARPVLMLAPSLIYTEVQDTAELRFRRGRADLVALFLSPLTLVLAAAWVVVRKPR
jgi:hypothetical protein